MGHVMVKHSIPTMKILPPLHGQDYQKRFEDQKDRTNIIFDKLLPIFKQNGCMPVMFIVQILDSLLSSDNKPVKHQAKSVSTKFKTYLQRNRIDFGQEDKQNIRIMIDGLVDVTLKQRSILYYDKNTKVNDFDFKTLSDRPYSELEGLTKQRLIIGLD
jgi:hypothetical protein